MQRPSFDQIALRLLEQVPLLAAGLVIPQVQLRHNNNNENKDVANISEKAVADGRLLQRLTTSLNANRSRVRLVLNLIVVVGWLFLVAIVLKLVPCRRSCRCVRWVRRYGEARGKARCSSTVPRTECSSKRTPKLIPPRYETSRFISFFFVSFIISIIAFVLLAKVKSRADAAIVRVYGRCRRSREGVATKVPRHFCDHHATSSQGRVRPPSSSSSSSSPFLTWRLSRGT